MEERERGEFFSSSDLFKRRFYSVHSPPLSLFLIISFEPSKKGLVSSSLANS